MYKRLETHERWEFSPISQHPLLLLVSGRKAPKLASKVVFPAIDFPKRIPAIICKFLDNPVKAFVTVPMRSLLEQCINEECQLLRLTHDDVHDLLWHVGAVLAVGSLDHVLEDLGGVLQHGGHHLNVSNDRLVD